MISIHVGAIYDSEPDKVIATSLEQDFDSPNGDTFGVTFDTFHDKSNVYMFLVNPRGAWKDAQVFDDSRYENAQWEGVAYEKTRMVRGLDGRDRDPLHDGAFRSEGRRSDVGREFPEADPPQGRRGVLVAARSPANRAPHVAGGNAPGARGAAARGATCRSSRSCSARSTPRASLRAANVKRGKGDAGLDLKMALRRR